MYAYYLKNCPNFLVKRAGKNVTNYQAFTRKMKKNRERAS